MFLRFNLNNNDKKNISFVFIYGMHCAKKNYYKENKIHLHLVNI